MAALLDAPGELVLEAPVSDSERVEARTSFVTFAPVWGLSSRSIPAPEGLHRAGAGTLSASVRP